MGDVTAAMPSFHLSSGDGEESSEESFVVLGASMIPDDSLRPIPSPMQSAVNIDLSNSTVTLPSMPHISQRLNSGEISLATISSDLSPEEVQQKVDMLVEENITLKDTLHQNNMAMKKQFDTLVMWQEDVMKVHQSHKEKFAETKKYIENLKAENAKLVSALQLANLSQETVRAELTQLRQQKAEYDKVKLQNQTIIQSSIDNVAKFELSVAQTKANDLEQCVAELQGKLTTAVEHVKTKDECVQKLSTDIAALRKYNDEIQLELTKQIKQNELVRESMENDLASLRLEKTTHQEQQVTEKDVEPLESFVHELASTREQLMMAQMKITDLESRGEQNKSNDADVKRLEQIVKELMAEHETMGVLKAQVEIYQADFEAERMARSALADEKDQISTDYQALQRRNQQLLEEVELLRADRVPAYRQNEPGRSTTAPSAPNATGNDTSSSPPPMRFICPLCNLKFRSLHLLEGHVDTCVDSTNAL